LEDSEVEKIFEKLVECGEIRHSPSVQRRKQKETEQKQKVAEQKQKAAEAAKRKEKEARKAKEIAERKKFLEGIGRIESNILLSYATFQEFEAALRNYDVEQKRLLKEKYAEYINSISSLGFLGDSDDGANNYMWLIDKQKPQAGSIIIAIVYVVHLGMKKINDAILNAKSEKEECRWIQLRDKVNEFYSNIESKIKNNR
jgi:ATPase subunit of ABC transporter with duplicated ATPase domains